MEFHKGQISRRTLLCVVSELVKHPEVSRVLYSDASSSIAGLGQYPSRGYFTWSFDEEQLFPITEIALAFHTLCWEVDDE
jgi:hypothetical protein